MSNEQTPISMDAYRVGITQARWNEMDQIANEAFEEEIASLSRRQREVFSRRMNPFKESQSEAGIAAELGISRRTVRTHLKRGMEKFRRMGPVERLF